MDPYGESETPWRDAETLSRLYHDEGLDQYGIAERLGCDQGTVSKWMKRHAIRARGKRETHGVAYATFVSCSSNGYEAWRCREGDTLLKVYVHRLMAVAEHGIDAVAGSYVHHVNGLSWDNRPANIELMSPTEHGELEGARRNA